MSIDTKIEFENNLLAQYGPLMGGQDLIRVLGYRSHSAFRRAKKLGVLGVKVFEIPDRRGRFALTRDIAAWLKALNSSANG